VWFIVKIVNSPVERKEARWRLCVCVCGVGGDWSKARAVIWVGTLCVGEPLKRVCVGPDGLRRCIGG
jgi:hypothetical protein